MRGRQKTFTGRVVSTKMSKTVVVEITWLQPHPIYRKPSRRITKTYAHDEGSRCQVGDVVRIQETRPLSHLKRWRVVDILERREVPEVMPAALDQPVLEEATPAGAPVTAGTTEPPPETREAPQG